MSAESLNQNFEQNKVETKEKHYLEEWFNELGQYEVQKEDWTETLYSILPELINKNTEVKDRTFLRNMILTNIEKFDTIQKWDVIEINQIDSNSYELRVSEDFFVINLYNESFTKMNNNENSSNTDILDWFDQYELSNEEVETLINAINIETNKAEVWLFAWQLDTYTIKVWNFIEWNLPTNAEPVDLTVAVDPNKVIEKTKDVMMGQDIDSINVNDITFSWEETMREETAKKVMQEFKAFVTSLIEWTEYRVYRSIWAMD